MVYGILNSKIKDQKSKNKEEELKNI